MAFFHLGKWVGDVNPSVQTLFNFWEGVLHVQKKVYARRTGDGVARLEERLNDQADQRDTAPAAAERVFASKARRRVRSSNPSSRCPALRLEEREEISRGLAERSFDPSH
jgi:hypothetical protein